MFAFAIWDSRRRELFLARDRLGIKPLYYAQTPGGLRLRVRDQGAARAPAITPDLDEEAFVHYLTFVSTPAPLTMFKGIRKLAPAERMTVSRRRQRSARRHLVGPDVERRRPARSPA